MKRLHLEGTGLLIAGVLAASLARPPALAASGTPGSAAGGVAGDCGRLAEPAERATCSAVQLREADRANDRLFTKLLGILPESEKNILISTQHSWAAERNQTCGLGDEGADHERWFRQILLEPGKTACVLKATNERVLALSGVDALWTYNQGLQSRPYEVAPAPRETRRGDPAPAAAECAPAASDAERSACLGSVLHDLDLTLNRVYRNVARSLTRAEGKRLREQQSSWLGARTRTCSLDDTATNRERWFQSVLADTRKTACVLQMTRERIVALAHSLPDR